jgi:hypothetical protein
MEDFTADPHHNLPSLKADDGPPPAYMRSSKRVIALEALPKLGQPRGDGLLFQDDEGVSQPGTWATVPEAMLKSTVCIVGCQRCP